MPSRERRCCPGEVLSGGGAVQGRYCLGQVLSIQEVTSKHLLTPCGETDRSKKSPCPKQSFASGKN